MRFVADECCDHRVVRALRGAGHDVLAVAEISPRATDPEVVALAMREGRILITEDKDFGRLAHAGVAKTPGVVLMRCPVSGRAQWAEAFLVAVADHGERMRGRFVVFRPGLIRFSGNK